jgi:hypothetical protein
MTRRCAAMGDDQKPADRHEAAEMAFNVALSKGRSSKTSDYARVAALGSTAAAMHDRGEKQHRAFSATSSSERTAVARNEAEDNRGRTDPPFEAPRTGGTTWPGAAAGPSSAVAVDDRQHRRRARP